MNDNNQTHNGDTALAQAALVGAGSVLTATSMVICPPLLLAGTAAFVVAALIGDNDSDPDPSTGCGC